MTMAGKIIAVAVIAVAVVGIVAGVSNRRGK